MTQDRKLLYVATDGSVGQIIRLDVTHALVIDDGVWTHLNHFHFSPYPLPKTPVER